MVLTLDGISTSASAEQSSKALFPIEVTPLAIVTSVKLLQLVKAQSPKLEMDPGIETPVRFLHLRKAFLPMVVQDSGMETLVMSALSLNAASPIATTALPSPSVAGISIAPPAPL